MRVCWNRQTGTFEGRVSLTYGFKSRHSHQPYDLENGLNKRFSGSFLLLKRACVLYCVLYCLLLGCFFYPAATDVFIMLRAATVTQHR